MRLPNEYQEVEYIESNGTQYIDAGLPPSNNTKVQFRLSNYSINSSVQYVFGSTSSWGNNMFGLLGTTGRSGDTINGHLLYNTSEYKLSSGYIGDGGAHVGELSSNGFYVDGTRISSVSGVFSGTLNMTIFAGNVNGIIGENERGAFKLYYFKVYESGTLVRDFVPCYRKSDGEIGLYDLVNNTFYTNAGTGVFTKGNDIGPTGKIQRIYIGDHYQVYPKWKPGANTIARYQFKSDIANHYGSDADWYAYSGSVSYENNMMKYTGELRKNKATLSGGYSGNFTVLSWRKYEGITSTLGLWRNNRENNSGMAIPGNAGTELCSAYIGGTWRAIPKSGISNGNHLFAMVRNGNTLYGYLDGEFVGSVSISGSLNSSLTCGSTVSGQGGTVGETIAENKARTAQEIVDYYNQTKATYLGFN